MPKSIKELSEEMRHHLLKAREITDAAEKDGDRGFTDEETTQLREHMAKATAAKAEIEKLKGNDEIRRTLEQLGDDIALNAKTDEHGRRQTASGFHLPDRGKSLGEQFVESAEYKGLLAQAPSGQFAKNQRVQSEMWGVKSLVTGGSDTSAGALVTNDSRGLLAGLDQFQRPLRLRDVVTPGNTTSDTVEYVRVTSVTNNAAPVAEATTAAAPTAPGTAGPLVNAAGGGYKPESGLALAKVTAPVRTVAHWMPATKRALSDPAQIRTLIDAFLLYGLEEELEDQMVQGDGTGENFEGLANVSGVQSQPWDTTGTGEDMQRLRTLRKAKTKVKMIGRSEPNAYLINPSDVEAIDLSTNGNADFYFGGPAGSGMVRTLWQLPVVETEAVPPGIAYCGDFRKAVLWDREQATVQITDSHLDFFVRNLVAILAEMRAAFGVIQPSAFVEIDLTAAP